MQWIEPVEQILSDNYINAMGGSTLVAQLLNRRGLNNIESALAFTDPDFYKPSSPLEMPDLERAVIRIQAAIRRQEKILVWGDFDVDGQTATTLLVSTLRQLGAQVSYHIPVRANESHGISVPVLKQLLTHLQAPVGLLLTCDTGISAHAAIDFAQDIGLDVVVTDHHEPPPKLPQAYALVNPRLLSEDHPFKTLPGVGVAYKLAEELFHQAGYTEKSLALLDLVALGIIADLAELRGETRYLLQLGLRRLRDAPRLGLQMVMELADLAPSHLSEEHVSYQLGPRLNAIGRLGDANPVVELLTTDDAGRARTLAYQLEGLNNHRQLLTSQVYRGALAMIEQEPALLDHAALVLAHPSWPAGVIGIVASRLVERFHKPVVLIATPEGQAGRASARSVEGLDITALIASQADLLEGYGGHAMAAGFSIQPESISSFRRGLNRVVEKSGLAPERILSIDGMIGFHALTLELVNDLDRLAPFGVGNPLPVFATLGVRLLQQTPVGRNQEHLLLTIEDNQGDACQMVWWQGADELSSTQLPEGFFDIAYTVHGSSYRGSQGVQITWKEYRQSPNQIDSHTARKFSLMDHRQEIHPLPVLKGLLQGSAAGQVVQIWAEAGAKQRLADVLTDKVDNLCNRLELTACDTLVIWSTPAGQYELTQALKRCQPHQVILFGVDPELDGLEAFLKRLVGLVKYVVSNSDGRVNLERLASAMAHRLVTVHTGVEWIAAQGYINLDVSQGGMLLLSHGSSKPDDEENELIMSALGCLKVLLEETAAFRAYFKRVKVESLPW